LGNHVLIRRQRLRPQELRRLDRSNGSDHRRMQGHVYFVSIYLNRSNTLSIGRLGEASVDEFRTIQIDFDVHKRSLGAENFQSPIA
jgi:hypothetical protein